MLFIVKNVDTISVSYRNYYCEATTYKVPAKPAALCRSNVGSGGRHIKINS